MPLDKKRTEKIMRKYKDVFETLKQYDKEKKKDVTITLSEKDMDTIEDRFFCKLKDKEYKKIKWRLINIWKQLCEEMGDYVN